MVDTPLAEATMIYRKPVKGSDPLAVQDVWGQQLETRTVDASEVEALRGDGWVAHPSHIEHPPKPEEAAGFVPDRGKADAELQELRDRIATLETDLKAATELADAESKAKDEALAKLEAATNAKPAGTLGVKGEAKATS